MIGLKDEKWEGLEELVPEIIKETKPLMVKAVNRGSKILDDEMHRTLEKAAQGRGRVYRHVQPPGSRTRAWDMSREEHQASKPGDPPARLTGRLILSLGRTRWPADMRLNVASSLVGVHGDAEVGHVKIANITASLAEYGGRNQSGARVLPRPWMEPSMQRATSKIVRVFEELVG